MFGKISIIGCGLIGSSILRATQEKKLAKKICVYDKSNKVIEYLKKNFTADICSNASETTKDADLIIISAPLSSYKEILISNKSATAQFLSFITKINGILRFQTSFLYLLSFSSMSPSAY